jgi:hypothetical protein
MGRWEWQKSKQNEDEKYKGSNEIATLSSKVRNNRGIKTNNIYSQMGEMCKTCGKIAP